MEVILYSKECNWYTRCCPLNGGVRYRECPLRETILYMYIEVCVCVCDIEWVYFRHTHTGGPNYVSISSDLII